MSGNKAIVIIAYCHGFWTGLDGRGTDACHYTNALRKPWIEGFDDGVVEKIKHEDAYKPHSVRATEVLANRKMRRILKANRQERYVTKRLREIAQENRDGGKL